jgi:hypothetical protein
MPLPCRCCNTCTPCTCSPSTCIDLVVFGGGCPGCLPLGTRIPLSWYPRLAPACPFGWISHCNDRTGFVNCTNSPSVNQLPFCCSTPFTTICPNPHDSLTVPGLYVDQCDPQINLACIGTGKAAYKLRFLWNCSSGSVPGGVLESISSDVQCDPFQITFTVFTQTVGNTPGGFPPCSGVPCTSVPTSAIVIPHV